MYEFELMWVSTILMSCSFQMGLCCGSADAVLSLRMLQWRSVHLGYCFNLDDIVGFGFS